MKRVVTLLVAACMAAGLNAAPAQMQAIVQGDSGLSLQMIQTPEPGSGEVLVKIYAAAVNPVDWKRKPPVPGFDAGGVIESAGPDVTNFKPGDKVIARVSGGYAQYALAQADEVVAKPGSFTFEQASGVPIAGVAGYRAVMEAKLKPGQRVAVIGAAGGSGSAAVQVAKSQGARVIAIGHSSQKDYLAGLKADEFVAYDRDDVAAKVKGVDAVLNMVDGQATPGLGYVKRGGYLTSIAGTVPGKEQCAAAGVTCVQIGGGGSYVGISNGEALAGLAALADKGQYDVLVSKTFPLAQAAAAQELNRTSDTIGKIVLVVDPKSKDR